MILILVQDKNKNSLVVKYQALASQNVIFLEKDKKIPNFLL